MNHVPGVFDLQTSRILYIAGTSVLHGRDTLVHVAETEGHFNDLMTFGFPFFARHARWRSVGTQNN